MLNFLPKIVLGILNAILLTLNVVVCCGPLFAVSIFKLILPFKTTRKIIDPIIIVIAEFWISCNKGWMNLTQKTRWQVQGADNLDYKGWYLVNANHQSWVDILVLQYVLNRKIPLLKFFLKQELIWVPIMGLAWWAMDFPFMKRYTCEYLEKHPEKKGQDLKTTQQACEKFEVIPTSVMNFLEGTRFTQSKHDKQKSPFRHLLKPKAGGIAFVLEAMNGRFTHILNATIVYPKGIPSFWQFMCGKVTDITVHIENTPIPADLIKGDYNNDAEYRERFQKWVHQLWEDKDRKIDGLLQHKPSQTLKTAS